MLRIGRELGDCLLNLGLFRLLGLLLLGRMGTFQLLLPRKSGVATWSLVIGCCWRPNCVRSTPKSPGKAAGWPRKGRSCNARAVR